MCEEIALDELRTGPKLNQEKYATQAYRLLAKKAGQASKATKTVYVGRMSTWATPRAALSSSS